MAGSITNLVWQWKDEKERELAGFDIERYFRAYLLTIVRNSRKPALRAKIGTEDVVYAGLASFFAGLSRDQYPNIRSREDIRRLLATIVCRALVDEVRKAEAGIRGGGKDVALADVFLDTLDSGGDSPELQVEEEDFLENLPEIVRGSSPRAIEILELRLEGLEVDDIADRLDVAIRTVYVDIQKMTDAIWDALGE